MNKLAIIIPAYKADFLGETLQSIVNQSCKDFNLYIGDDNSPYNLYEIVKKYEKIISIKYVKFKDNLGGTNLVNHWNRCLSLAEKEEYLWLFSDDDIMEKDCVEQFNKTINNGLDHDVFHFNIDIIDGNGKLVRQTKKYPLLMSAVDFFSSLFKKKIEARVPEFIFKASSIIDRGGFVNFDLAWRSDNATVIENSIQKGIFTIEGPKVLWRQSTVNISSINNDLAYRKDEATIKFFNWIEELFKKEHIECSLSKLYMILIYRQKLGIMCKTYNPIKLWHVSKRFNYIHSVFDNLCFVIISYFVRLQNLLGIN